MVIACGTEIIARHPRSYEREDFVFDPLHYLALIEQKINALDQAAPLADWKLPEEFATILLKTCALIFLRPEWSGARIGMVENAGARAIS